MPHSSELHDFLGRCRVQADGLVATSEDSPWRLGAVAMAHKDAAFAVVRKAPVEAEAYEFEGLYSLPGGMVRIRDLPEDAMDPGIEHLALRSLASRARREAGLELASDCKMIDGELGPVVTRYTAKGRQRFTLVIACTTQVQGHPMLKAGDRSVDHAGWMTVPIDWPRLAPANCLIIAHSLWSGLEEDERGRAREPVQAAAALCSSWARSLALPAVPVPWSDEDTLTAWRTGWSRLA